MDRYTKIVLTVIAGALVYLCVVVTAFPAVQAQVQSTARPGESTGPQEVVVVGWRHNTPLPIVAPEPLRVITEQRAGTTDRVMIAGWEEVERGAAVERQINTQTLGLPVVVRAR
jgi:hypothetical protein